jgi:hypothetical protein
MPLHNLGERSVVALPHEPHQQFAIRGHDRLGVIPRGRRGNINGSKCDGQFANTSK